MTGWKSIGYTSAGAAVFAAPAGTPPETAPLERSGRGMTGGPLIADEVADMPPAPSPAPPTYAVGGPVFGPSVNGDTGIRFMVPNPGYMISQTDIDGFREAVSGTFAVIADRFRSVAEMLHGIGVFALLEAEQARRDRKRAGRRRARLRRKRRARTRRCG
ncbi:Uncharacterised protein [Mycobacteroides abscessus subsp. abscessus]|nr:Uncharacterised protein [Mycobacteroides abscessus subsp. abscessus]